MAKRTTAEIHEQIYKAYNEMFRLIAEGDDDCNCDDDGQFSYAQGVKEALSWAIGEDPTGDELPEDVARFPMGED